MITIVDYGSGNLFSIQNMFNRIGVKTVISSDSSAIANAGKLILPGIGAFDSCMQKVNQSGLREHLNQKALKEKIPVLGICVGMQLMMEGSEEGVLQGLGWIKGRTIKFKQNELSNGYRIPHMGWAEVEIKKSSRLMNAMYNDPRFYFAHSYHVAPESEADTLLSALNGYSFTAAIECDNIMGVQFHPEKSHKYGMKLLENFANL